MNTHTMMRLSSRALILPALAAGIFSAAPAAVAEPAADDAAAQRVAAQRQAAVQDSLQQLQEARSYYAAGKYSEAVESYRNALAVIPKAPATQVQVTFIRDSLADALIAKAMDYRKVGRTDEAKQFLMEAIELSPENKLAKAELEKTLDPVRTNPALTPQHVGDVHEVQRLLTLAQGYYDLGSFDQAIETFRSVLKIDAYNAAAQRGMEQCYKATEQSSHASRDAYRAKALADVDAQYDANEPDDFITPPEDLDVSAELGTQEDTLVQENKMGDLLSKVIIPQVLLEEATIYDIAEMLRNRIASAENEMQNAGGQVPRMNVISYFGTQDSKSYQEMQEKRVSLNLQNISVTGLLDILVNQMGISYYFDKNNLVLTYSGKDFGPMMERTFMVPVHFFTPSSNDEFSDEAEESGFSRIRTSRIDAKAALKGLGVSFPEGSYARYFPSSRSLRVRNTAHNLDYIGDLLSIPANKERSLVLSVIMISVTEKQLEDLGFEWMFNVSLGGDVQGGGGGPQTSREDINLPMTGGVTFDSFIGDAGQPHVTDGLRSGSSVLNATSIDRLITAGSSAGYGSTIGEKSPGIFGFRGVWNTADVTMLMRGLSQKTGTDLLQSPRIVFAPEREEQVTFGTVREVFFPSGYDEPQVTSNAIYLPSRNSIISDSDGGDGNNDRDVVYAATASPAHPTDFTRYGMTDEELAGFGTIIQIHSASVSQDGNVVDIALTTTTNEFEGFVNWGQPFNIALMNNTEIKLIRLSDNLILQPIIKRYRTNTQLSLASGSVIVLGGLKEARKVDYEDKVPVLGDLPMVGRFFRSSGERDERKAIIYFAKVDVVDPTGRSVKTGEMVSAPGSNSTP